MVTIALFDTLLSLQNEQIMNELILKYLIGAQHIPIAQKHKINRIQSYAKTVDYFLDLAPDVMKNSKKILAEHKSLDYQQPTSLTAQRNPSNAVSMTIGTNWNHYGLHANGESLYSNYHAYLYDAHQKIKQIKQTCDQWSDNYFYKNSSLKSDKDQQINSKIVNDQLIQKIRSFLSEFNGNDCSTSTATTTADVKFDSLQSIGESSGYESMKYRPDDDDEQQVSNNQQGINQKTSTVTNNNVTFVKNIEPWRKSQLREEQIIELELNEKIFTQGTVSLGRLLIKVVH